MHRNDVCFLPLGRVNSGFKAFFKNKIQGIYYRIVTEIPLYPCAFLVSRERMIRSSFSLHISIFNKGDGNCGINIGIVLPVSIALHGATKNSLKIFAFASTLAINKPISIRGELLETVFY